MRAGAAPGVTAIYAEIVAGLIRERDEWRRRALAAEAR